MNLRQLLNYIYVWALPRVDPERREEWIRELDAPYWRLQGASGRPVSQSVVDDELALFRASA